MWPNPQFPAVTGEILNGKLNFLCSVIYYFINTFAKIIAPVEIKSVKRQMTYCSNKVNKPTHI